MREDFTYALYKELKEKNPSLSVIYPIIFLRCTSYMVRVVVFNDTLNNILVNIVAVSFIGGGNWSTQRNHRPFASHWWTASYNVLSSTPRLSGFELPPLAVISTDYNTSYKGNLETKVVKTIWIMICLMSIVSSVMLDARNTINILMV